MCALLYTLRMAVDLLCMYELTTADSQRARRNTTSVEGTSRRSRRIPQRLPAQNHLQGDRTTDSWRSARPGSTPDRARCDVGRRCAPCDSIRTRRTTGSAVQLVIVVDSAAVLDALSVVAGSENLRTYLASEDLHAPGLIDYEVVSALRGLTLGGHLSPTRAQDLLTDFADLPIQRWPFEDALRRRAFQLRDNVSSYDAAFVALAEALDCPLVTRDSRLSRSSGHDARIEVR